jgi:hypothetical protein
MVFSLKKAMKTAIYGLPRTFGLRTEGSTEFERKKTRLFSDLGREAQQTPGFIKGLYHEIF